MSCRMQALGLECRLQLLSQSATQLLEEAEGHLLAQDGIAGQRAQHLRCHRSGHVVRNSATVAARL